MTASSEADARAAHEAQTTAAHGGLVAADDARLTDTRTPSNGTVTTAKFAASAIDPAAGTAGARTLGTGAAQAAAGNDARLSDTRTPTDASVTLAKLASGIIDPAAGTAGARTLGTGATQAAAGNDSRLSDARTPTAHHASHATGGTDPLAPADVGAAPATPTVGTALGTTGTVALDLAALNGTVQWITATGTLTFTTSNLAAGRNLRLFIDAGGSTRTLAWPSWIAHGAALPASLASGKRLAVSLLSLGTTDANVSAAAAVQP